MYPITVTIHTPEQFMAVSAALSAPSAPKAAPKQEAPKEAPKPLTADASVAPPAATPDTPAPTAAVVGKTYTIDDAKALTMKIVADKGRDTAVNLLKGYGVPVAAKLPADKIAAFCTDAEKVLA